MGDHHSALRDRELKSIAILAGTEPASGAGAGGTSGIYDMQGWAGIEFCLTLHSLTYEDETGVLSFKVWESDAANMAASTAVSGGSITALAGSADTGGFAIVDHHPEHRYCRVVVLPTTGTAVFSVMATQYGRTGILPVHTAPAQVSYSGTAIEYVAHGGYR